MENKLPPKLPNGSRMIPGKVYESTRPGKKKMVYSCEKGTCKLLHFGDSSMGHNYSPEARKAFKARHAKNIQRGKLSPAWWADKVLWTKGGDKKNPPKSQKYVRGKK